jgi:DEAD/DEAH box helicase domain-containing protein
MGLWSNDPNDYGPNWQTQRAQTRARDGYRCQVCGAPEEGRSHEVHHKTPFRAFESFELANQLENLITLCPACHRRVETAVRVRSGLAGLAHVLGHLAPFFLMCDTRDLGVHSDPQSPITGGAPTVVIYDQIPAGIGFSERLFELHDELVLRAQELVSACECEDGCPSCVGPGGENGYGGKRETLALLQVLGMSGKR